MKEKYETPTITDIRPITQVVGQGDSGEHGEDLPFDPTMDPED